MTARAERLLELFRDRHVRFGRAKLGIGRGMHRSLALAGFYFGKAGWVAANAGIARVEQRLHVLERVLIVEQIGQEKRGEAAAAVEPIVRVATNQPGAEPGIALHAIVGRAPAERAASECPEDLVNARVNRPDGATRFFGRERAVDLGDPELLGPLKTIVDHEIRVQVRKHRRETFDRRQRPAHACDRAPVVGQRCRREHVMADFVRENFEREVADARLDDFRQAHDHGLIDQSDHREAAGQSFFCCVFDGQTQRRRAKSRELAPNVERGGPSRFPARL